MEKNVLLKCLILAVLLLCLPGCMREELPHCEVERPAEEAASGKSKVTFNVMRTGVKSSINPEEETIENFAIAVFKDGNLDNYGYAEGAESITLELLAGQSYNIYATANTGRPNFQTKESDFLNICTLVISDIAELGDCLPMSWNRKNVQITGTSQSVQMEMERMVSKIFFSVNKDLLAGIEVTSARLCQGASAVYPFRWERGNVATEEDGTIDGDYASAEDLKILNDGGEIVFYAIENCQGDLLPDNTDQWSKVPDSLDYGADLCTYLEVGCRFREGFLYEGDVTYRFYAGMDNCRNFDIRRNIEQHISLTLSQD